MHFIKRVLWTTKLLVNRNVKKYCEKIYFHKLNNLFLNKGTVNLFSSHKMTTDNRALFSGKLDRFNGITVQSKEQECLDGDFKQKLEGK